MDVLNNYFVGIRNLDTQPESISEPELSSQSLSEGNPKTKYEYYDNKLTSDDINGYGKLCVSDQNVIFSYNGPISNSKMNGNGFIIYISNKENPLYKSYKGELKDNVFNGKGKITFTNGDIFIGSFTKGKKDGPGKMYNSNGDIIMDNIWKNDIVCGKVDYVDYYHGTKIPKVIGQLYDSVKFGHWLQIREDKTIEKIDYFADPKSDTDPKTDSKSDADPKSDADSKSDADYKSDADSKSSSIIKSLSTHDTGYLKTQCLSFKSKLSIEELCLGSFTYFEDKLIYKNNGPQSKLDNVTNDISVNYSEVYKYALPSDDSTNADNTMYLYLDSKGKKVKITEFIGGKEYDRVVHLDDGTGNKNLKFYVNQIHMDAGHVITKSSIYQIEAKSDFILPMLQYEGEINSSYLSHGNGTIYSNGNIKMSGNFDKGHIVNGILFAEHDTDMYMYYEGSFKNDKPDGEGTFYDHKGRKIFEGQVSDGKRHGDGISYWVTCSINWKGKWHNDKKHGKGTLYSDNGELICNCVHENDQFIDFVND
jgi:hypothetical protein